MTFPRSFLLVYLLIFSTQAIAEFTEISDFGENPGALTATAYLTKDSESATVVLLHGCGQNGQWLAQQTGLLDAAKSKQFNLLIPQQAKENNMQLCFNWFSPADQMADSGETASIINLINTLKKQQNSSDVYLIGLSAGGAMATSLSAQYPQLFSASAVIAGIGYPCADTLIKALSCMKNGSSYDISELANRVLEKQPEGIVNWPNMIFITGSSDAIVSPTNSEQMFQQWRIILAAHEPAISALPNDQIITERHINKATNSYTELLKLTDIGHGWPINSATNSASKAAPFVLDSALSTTDYLIEQWDL